jgi:hypothetical protein
MDYWKANEINSIIDKYRKFHPTLVGAKFACIFREKAQTSDGEPIVGKVRKVSDKYKPLMQDDYDYMMEIGADAWQELSTSEREAWVDHLLKHCYGEEDESTGEMSWKTRRPEIVAFSDVLDRHGVNWNDNLKQLKKVDLDDPGSSGSSDDSSDDGDSDDQTSSEGNSDDSDDSDDFDDMIDNL